MAEHAATEILDALMRNLKEILRTESIVGQPIQAGNTTILPVIKVFVGFGAGGGAGTPEKAAGASANSMRGMTASGGGGGGGLSITPVGFLVIEEGRATMITPGSTRWEWVVDAIPELWEKMARVRQESKERKTGSARTSPGGSETPSPGAGI
jgi:uncharacterized spore protein YtfJ